MEGDTLESFEGCEKASNKHTAEGAFNKKDMIKPHQLENGDQNDDDESLYADSEFAEAIAKAAGTSSSSKLKSSEISKLRHNVSSKKKRPEGIIRPSLRNHPRGGRMVPIPDDMQVVYN